MIESKRCAVCSEPFHPRPQSPRQQVCPKPDCQHERRRRWQQAKRRSDPDYRANEARARQAWLQRNPDYWREYRRAHPDYAERNRVAQSARNLSRRAGPIAKMDACPPLFRLPSGLYEMREVSAGIANGDAWTVEIAVLSIKPAVSVDCKERP